MRSIGVTSFADATHASCSAEVERNQSNHVAHFARFRASSGLGPMTLSLDTLCDFHLCSPGYPLLTEADIHNPCAMTFNHGVEGSSPSALTKEINNLAGNCSMPESLVSALCLQ